MAEAVLAATPPRFTLIGLSLGGYVAFEIVRRAARPRRAAGPARHHGRRRHAARRAGRLADIAKVEAGGIEALIPELPGALAAAGARRSAPTWSR